MVGEEVHDLTIAEPTARRLRQAVACREVGPGRPGHALMLTRFARVIKAGALPSRRVSHADQRYYDPLGLPLPSKGVE